MFVFFFKLRFSRARIKNESAGFIIVFGRLIETIRFVVFRQRHRAGAVGTNWQLPPFV